MKEQDKTISGLNKTIDKLREENKKLFKYKEMFTELSMENKELIRQLGIKRMVVRVKKHFEDNFYLMRIISCSDSEEGMQIIVED